jgi:hypothetical protein
MAIRPSEVAIIAVINKPILPCDLVPQLLVEIDISLITHRQLILNHKLFALLLSDCLVSIEEVHKQLIQVGLLVPDHLQFVLAHELSQLV